MAGGAATAEARSTVISSKQHTSEQKAIISAHIRPTNINAIIKLLEKNNNSTVMFMKTNVII